MQKQNFNISIHQESIDEFLFQNNSVDIFIPENSEEGNSSINIQLSDSDYERMFSVPSNDEREIVDTLENKQFEIAQNFENPIMFDSLVSTNYGHTSALVFDTPVAQSLHPIQPKEHENAQPRAQNEEKVQIIKSAKKNALQFFSGLFLDYACQSNHQLTREEIDMIKKLKIKPCIANFDALFKKEGSIHLLLGQFFQGKALWFRIMNSKVRHYFYKSVYKNTISVLKDGFIRGQLSRLSVSKAANGKDTDILSQQ